MAGIFAQSALQIGATQQPNLNPCPDWQGTVWQTISETLVLRMGPLMAVMAYLYLLVGFFQPFIKVTLRTVPRSNKIINNNNNNLHLYSANLYMNIFGCALQYCYIKFMLKVTKA